MSDMPQPTKDEGSIKGRGASIMLPPRGNPFARGDETLPAAEGVWPVGAEMAGDMSGRTGAAPEGLTEPRDLTPEDLATMFPPASEGRPFGAPALSMGGAGPGAPPLELLMTETAPPATEPAAMGQPGTPAVEATAPAVVADVRMESEVGAAVEMGIGPGTAVPPDTLASTPPAAGGDRPSTSSVAAHATLQISEDVGLAVTTYARGAALPATPALVDFFVPDRRLLTLWLEIDSVEAQVTSTNRLSLKVAQELLDRLAAARNYLMHDRASYEEAEREVAEVKYRLVRTRSSSALQQPRPILAYLIVFLVLLGAGFVASGEIGRRLGDPSEIAGMDPGSLWFTMLWGAVGGVSGALYRLWRHVAQQQDYDPQHAQWYYLSPLMGLMFAPLVALVAQLGLPAFFAFASSEVGSVEVAPAILYLLAWTVGFQHNLLISLINAVLKRLKPAEPDQITPGPPSVPPMHR